MAALDVAERRALIEARGSWAFWPDGSVKADWLLQLGPKGWAERQARNGTAMRVDRARRWRLRREGFTLDAERRLIASPQRPAVPLARARRPRRRNARTRAATRRVPPREQDDPDPELAAAPPLGGAR
jgi:hypothetical protein